jgi:hypothetical protein
MQRWFSSVKRNIARFVPSMKNACDAARVVMTPAVASGGKPYAADWVVRTSTFFRFAPLDSSAA